MLAKVPQQVLAHRIHIAPKQRHVQVGQNPPTHVPTAHVKVKFGRDFVTRVVPHLCRLLVIVVLIMDVNRVVSRCGVDGVVILFKHARMG